MAGPQELPQLLSMHRVKLYKLSGQGQWEDKGTGHISVEYMQQANAMGLVVIAEDGSGKTLLVHTISRKQQAKDREDMYTRSGEPIITWHDPEFCTDIAISFQEQLGCDHIWNQIKQVQEEEDQRKQSMGQGGGKSLPSDPDGPSGSGHPLGNGESRADLDMDLPPPDRRNLEAIMRVLSHVLPSQRDRIAGQLMRPNYLAQLLDMFKQCEDLEDAEGLAHLYHIVRSAIMLNDSSVLEEMLREEHVMDVLGALEYDPDLKAQQQHRDFLQSHVQFKEVVPIDNPQVLAKIHQTYRIQYLKDVILPRSLDDATYATLSSLALFNNMEVVSSLMADAGFLPQLFGRLQAADSSDPQAWHDLVAFLQEFCGLARHLQQQPRNELFGKLVQLGVFDVVTRIMASSSDEVKLKATDILMSTMQHDVAALRTFLYQPTNTLFSLLVSELTDGADTGLGEQVCELLKVLLDPDTMDTTPEKNDFLDVFYDKYMVKMLAVFTEDAATNRDGKRHVHSATLGLLVDLLCFCVQNHSYRIKYYTLKNNLVEKVLRLTRRREKWLVCAAVRFLRCCIAMKDEFFQKYLLRNNLLDPVMSAFFQNGERYNLLNSAVLELADYIAKENIKPLLENLVETYGHRFEEVSYVDTFRKLRLRYDQAPERGGSADAQGGDGPSTADGGGGSAAGVALHGRRFVFMSGEGGHGGGPGGPVLGGGRRRQRRDDRDLEKDEEDYFTGDDDDGSDDPDDGKPGAGPGAGAADATGGAPPPPLRRPRPGARGDDDDDDDYDGPSGRAPVAHHRGPLGIGAGKGPMGLRGGGLGVGPGPAPAPLGPRGVVVSTGAVALAGGGSAGPSPRSSGDGDGAGSSPIPPAAGGALAGPSGAEGGAGPGAAARGADGPQWLGLTEYDDDADDEDNGRPSDGHKAAASGRRHSDPPADAGARAGDSRGAAAASSSGAHQKQQQQPQRGDLGRRPREAAVDDTQAQQQQQQQGADGGGPGGGQAVADGADHRKRPRLTPPEEGAPPGHHANGTG